LEKAHFSQLEIPGRRQTFKSLDPTAGAWISDRQEEMNYRYVIVPYCLGDSSYYCYERLFEIQEQHEKFSE